jgi:hypothetical protein
MSGADPPPANDAESDSLAERLARHAASPALQDEPQMQRDLVSASQRVADFQILLNAWRDAFAHRDVGQEFAKMLVLRFRDPAQMRAAREFYFSPPRAKLEASDSRAE